MTELSEEARKYMSLIGKKGNANRTFEQRSIAAKKAAATRNKNNG